MSTGENLKRIREYRGMTQKELAERIGVSRASVNLWEVGKLSMTLYSAALVADALDVSLDVLAGRIRASRREK